MSRTLIVARHGHAVEGVVDFERTLSERGVSEVNSAGKTLAARGTKLDAVLASAAPRAAATATALAELVGFEGQVQFVNDLYLAEPLELLRHVCATTDDVQTLLLVGHNPGLSTFVQLLSGQPCELHTAQVVHLALGVNLWSEVSFE